MPRITLTKAERRNGTDLRDVMRGTDGVTPDSVISVEDLASALKRIDAAITKLRAAGVSNRFLCVLINDVTGGPTHGVGKKQIERVLEALPTLCETYLTK